ncbi:hypothetical protein D3C71_1295630 [compost metagenome]
MVEVVLRQAFGGRQLPEAINLVGQGAKRLLDKIGNPLCNGQIQAFFGIEVVGDCGDVVPGALGDIAGGGTLNAIFAEHLDGGGDQLLSRLLTPCPAGGLIIWH